MMSKNKRAMTVAERAHVERIKSMACVVCGDPPPCEAHEIEQGLWWLAIPLCADCHRGSHNGIHGRKAIWNAQKQTELTALNYTMGRLFS